jgi:hypothetical protein
MRRTAPNRVALEPAVKQRLHELIHLDRDYDMTRIIWPGPHNS